MNHNEFPIPDEEQIPEAVTVEDLSFSPVDAGIEASDRSNGLSAADAPEPEEYIQMEHDHFDGFLTEEEDFSLDAEEIPSESLALSAADIFAPETDEANTEKAEAEDAGIEAEASVPEEDLDLTLLNMTLSEMETAQEPEEPNDQEYRDNGEDFNAMLHAPEKKAVSPSHRRPARKGRPKRKKGEGLLGIPNILATCVWLALILAIGVTAGRMLWVCAAEVLAFGREDRPVTVTIYEADTMEDITNKLYDAGLIHYKGLFGLYASISDAEEDIKPGIYDLNTRYDYHALVNFMTPKSSREVIELTIPEGYTCRQIFALLEEYKICTAVDAAAYAASGELDDYWFLEGLDRGAENCLEGYLFPDTYEFYKNSTPREALQRMLDNFAFRFSDEMRSQIDKLNAKLGANYTIQEITIIASLIEKETAGDSESPLIASVIYNRLHNWGNTPAYLNIDASIIYALNGKTDLTAEDMRVDSPYNTYLNTGLTPTPIANPGLASLKAALNPADSGYYFYVLNPGTGKHQFSKTQAEHDKWIAEFYG